MIKGSYTAIVTPFKDSAVDEEGLQRLVEFQIENNIDGVLAVGTTGESPTLTWDEHLSVIETVRKKTKDKCFCIAGAGSNNTKESLVAIKHAAEIGVDAVLLVDPYYNGPSSLEIRREYLEEASRAFPNMEMISYVIPGRTGAQVYPEDLGILNENFSNFNTVKEATGDVENMKRTRACCGPDFSILSGDDGVTFEIMTNPDVKCAGVISVATNIAPKAVSDMVRFTQEGNIKEAEKLSNALKPLFDIGMVKTMETTRFGETLCRARNPLPIKTLMSILGLPSGMCRQPLGKMTKKGIDLVLDAARSVQESNPEIFEPMAQFFNVDVKERLTNPANWEPLCYKEY